MEAPREKPGLLARVRRRNKSTGILIEPGDCPTERRLCNLSNTPPTRH